MRLTITKKLSAGIISLSLISSFAVVAIYFMFARVRTMLHQMTEVAERRHEAANQMEAINIRTGFGVMQYQATGEPQYRRQVEKDATDFLQMKAQYDRFANTPQAQELGGRSAEIYQTFHLFGISLMDSRDKQAALVAEVGEHFAIMDEILDDHLQAQIDQTTAEGTAKLLSAVQLEADLTEVGTWLGFYLKHANPDYRERIANNTQDFRREMGRLKSYTLTESEQQWVGKLVQRFDTAALLIQEILTLHDTLEQRMAQFLSLRVALENLQSNEIHVLTQQELATAQQRTYAAMSQGRFMTLGIVGFSLCLGVGLIISISRRILASVGQLVEGADRFSRGELTHRLRVTTPDEFGRIATAFNDMAEKRQQAEAALQAANAALEQRVEERTVALHASEEQYRELFENAHDLVYIRHYRV